MDKKDYKTISFYKFALSIGAIEDKKNLDINIEDLLFRSFLFLNKDVVLTKKQEQQYHVFKDKYNRYLNYCIEEKLIKKDLFHEVKDLNITTVPDMSKIKIPDISKELKELNFDIDSFAKLFSKIS